MAKISAKRNSETALPPAKRHQTSTSPSPSPDHDHESSSSSPAESAPVAAKRIKKAVRKSEPGRLNRLNDDEYDEDVGRTESQTFLKLVAFEARKKQKMSREAREFMERFERGVMGRRAELMVCLEERGLDLSRRDSQFYESFKAAYGASRGRGADPTQDFTANYKKSQDIINAALSLVSKFEEVAERVERIDGNMLVENEWGAADDGFKELLSTGKAVGVERYRRMLNASQEKIVLEGDEKEAEGVLFKDVREGKWGEVMKRQQKALKKLARTVEVA